MIDVLIVDDQQLVRTGFRMIVDAEDDMRVVGEASDGREALDAAGRLRPDVVLMDIRMPVLDGIEATRRIAGDGRHEAAAADGVPHVLILTTFDLDEYVFEALRAGASGFLLKDVPPGDLVDGIRVVARGESLLAPSVTKQLIAEFVKRTPATRNRDALDALTERELEVLGEVAKGRSNAEIAAALYVSETTVKTHVSRILMKLDLRDRVQAVVYAYETGLVSPGEG